MAKQYTDIAFELYGERKGTVPNGVKVSKHFAEGMCMTRVDILKSGLKREKGRYITLETKNLAMVDLTNESFIDAIASELRRLIEPKGKVLVVGVGNRSVLADSLGPATADKIFVSPCMGERPIKIRDVYAISPGVKGDTGMSTAEIISTLVRHVRPVCVIAVDSLCTGTPERMGCSVQLSNAGLTPQSTQKLTVDTLGVPVIAIGVPTITHMHLKNNIISVAPKDIEKIVQNASCLLALAINRALQPALSIKEICFLTN